VVVRVLAVDTDAKGSVAVLDSDQMCLDVYALPNVTRKVNGKNQTRLDYPVLVALMADLISHADVAILEEQWSRPLQDSSYTFSFGVTFGDIRTAVASAMILRFDYTPELVRERMIFTPGAEWKTDMRLGKDKKVALETASRIFPTCKHAWKLVSKHTSAAEASLLALWGILSKGQTLKTGQTVQPPRRPYSTVVPSLVLGE
jgi:hypothetical protein